MFLFWKLLLPVREPNRGLEDILVWVRVTALSCTAGCYYCKLSSFQLALSTRGSRCPISPGTRGEHSVLVPCPQWAAQQGLVWGPHPSCVEWPTFPFLQTVQPSSTCQFGGQCMSDGLEHILSPSCVMDSSSEKQDQQQDLPSKALVRRGENYGLPKQMLVRDRYCHVSTCSKGRCHFIKH